MFENEIAILIREAPGLAVALIAMVLGYKVVTNMGEKMLNALGEVTQEVKRANESLVKHMEMEQNLINKVSVLCEFLEDFAHEQVVTSSHK